jgi:hypothetical protein
MFKRTLLWMGAALAVPLTAHALNETHVYGIANFGGPGQCGTPSMTHTVHTDTAAAFASVFTLLKAVSAWDEVYTRNNMNACGTYFTDASKSSIGDDVALNYGADEPDIFYVHTHGGHDDFGSSLSMGNAAYDCSVRTDTEMLWGNPSGSGDLEFAVVKACQSGDYGVWQNGGYRAKFTTTDSQMSLWNAFHGDSSCGDHVTSYVSTYSWSSLFEGVGENWIDAAYDGSIFPDDDDCPVSIVMGSSHSARKSQYAHGGWLDRKNTGSKTGSTYWFIAGCDPSSGDVLPN